MITQCEIRKLYAQKSEPGNYEAIELAKSYERRRCGHHPEEYPEPLSTLECMRSVVDPKETNQNKHRYVVASQAVDVRRMLRGVRGVPLIYIKRSVMILEPMADESALVRSREEKSKFRAEIKGAIGKRKREEKDGDDDTTMATGAGSGDEEEKTKKKKRTIGPKGPNPLSVKKAKKKMSDGGKVTEKQAETAPEKDESTQDAPEKTKRKRRRKNKSADGGEGEGGERLDTAMASAE